MTQMSNRRCWLSRTLGLSDPCVYRADGMADWMHVGLAEHWLSKAPTGPQLTKEQANDARLTFDGCRRHHTQLDVTKKLRLSREDIPESVEQFAAEYGVTEKLDREYGPRTGEAR